LQLIAFYLDTFFWRCKRKYPVVGARIDLNKMMLWPIVIKIQMNTIEQLQFLAQQIKPNIARLDK